MLSLPSSVRIFLCREPVDFRKAHDGLAALVRSQLEGDPLDGSLFVFLNKRADRIKLLQWDGNGLWLHYKRTGPVPPCREGVRLVRSLLAGGQLTGEVAGA